MQENIRSISLKKITWSQIENRAKQLDTNCSDYTEQLYLKDIQGHMFKDNITSILLLLLLAITTTILSIMVIK